MGLKQWIKDWKETSAKKKELSKIQKEAYFNEMKNQAKIMGEKQAKMETRHREKVYGHKLEVIEQRKTTKTTMGPVDVFGLNKNQNKKTYNVIKGKYEN